MNNIPTDEIDIVSRFLALVLSLSEDERKQLITEWERRENRDE